MSKGRLPVASMLGDVEVYRFVDVKGVEMVRLEGVVVG